MGYPGLKTHRPKVVANLAITWDGRITTRARTPSDFSSLADKRRLLEIRAEGDAVVVGATTVAADSMSLGLPDRGLREMRVARGQREYPLRVLITGGGNVDPSLSVFSQKFSPIVIYTTARMPFDVRRSLSEVAEVQSFEGTELDLREILESLWGRFGVRTMICEGGGTLFSGLLAAGLVDELCLTVCPRIFGGSTGVTLTGGVSAWLPSSVNLVALEFQQFGDEVFTRWQLEY